MKQYKNNFDGTITEIVEKYKGLDCLKFMDVEASQKPIPLTFKTDKEV